MSPEFFLSENILIKTIFVYKRTVTANIYVVAFTVLFDWVRLVYGQSLLQFCINSQMVCAVSSTCCVSLIYKPKEFSDAEVVEIAEGLEVFNQPD